MTNREKITWLKLSRDEYHEGIYWRDDNYVKIYYHEGYGFYTVLLGNMAIGHAIRIGCYDTRKEARSFMYEFMRANPIVTEDGHTAHYDCCNNTGLTNRGMPCTDGNGYTLPKQKPKISRKIHKNDPYFGTPFYIPNPEWEAWMRKDKPKSCPYSFVGRITLNNLVTRESTIDAALLSSKSIKYGGRLQKQISRLKYWSE